MKNRLLTFLDFESEKKVLIIFVLLIISLFGVSAYPKVINASPKYKLATDSDFSGTSNMSFRYIGNDEYVEVPHVIKGVDVTSYFLMFDGTSVKGVKSTNKNIMDMTLMFNNNQATELDLNNLDTSNVTNMGSMFRSSKATKLNLSGFNTSKVTNMSYMFDDNQAIELDLSSFDTSKVTNMSNMFSNSQATELDLSNFDTSEVINMSTMFRNSQATELNLSSFDTSNVTSMNYMFEGNQATELDLSSFDTSNVTNMSAMFSNNQATKLDLSSFDTSNVTSVSNMFFNSRATKGYTKTQEDADRFNNSSGKPSDLVFIVKEYEWIDNGDGTATITNYIGTKKDIVIPDELGGLKVTEIGFEAFRNKQLTKVVMPSGLKRIGANAFQENQLTNVIIPDGVSSLGGYAFYGNKLTDVTIPNALDTIMNGVFQNNQLTEILIPETVKTVSNFAFQENKITTATIMGEGNKTYLAPSVFHLNQSNPKDLIVIGHLNSNAQRLADQRGYTFVPFDPPVNIPDVNLRNAITDQLSLSRGTQIMKNAHMEKLTYLNVVGKSVQNLSGLEHAVNLEYLVVNNQGSNVGINDIDPISRLTKLTYLDLGYNEIVNIGPVNRLTNIRTLTLTSNDISNLSAIANLSHLEDLRIDKNNVDSLSAIRYLPNLTKFNFSNNDVFSLGAIKNNNKLTTIEAANNGITDVYDLSGLVNLEKVILSGNNISSLNGLSSLEKLKTLELDKNNISSVSPLANLNNLSDLKISNNRLTDISMLSKVSNIVAKDQEVFLNEVVAGDEIEINIKDKSGYLNPTFSSLEGEMPSGTYKDGILQWNIGIGMPSAEHTLTFSGNNNNFTGSVTQEVNVPIIGPNPIYLCKSDGSFDEVIFNEDEIGNRNVCESETGVVEVEDIIGDQIAGTNTTTDTSPGDFEWELPVAPTGAPSAKIFPTNVKDFKEEAEKVYAEVLMDEINHLEGTSKPNDRKEAPFKSVNKVYDLAIESDVTLDPVHPKSNQKTKVTMTVCNRGNQNIGSYNAAVSFSGNVSGAKSFDGISRGPYNNIDVIENCGQVTVEESRMYDIEKPTDQVPTIVSVSPQDPEVRDNDKDTTNNRTEFNTEVRNPNATVYVVNLEGDSEGQSTISETGGVRVVVENNMFRDISSPRGDDKRNESSPSETTITVTDVTDENNKVEIGKIKPTFTLSSDPSSNKKIIDITDLILDYARGQGNDIYKILKFSIKVDIPHYEGEVDYSGVESYDDNSVEDIVHYFPPRPNISVMECNEYDNGTGNQTYFDVDGSGRGPVKSCVGHYPNNPSTAIEDGMQAYHFVMYRFFPTPMPKYKVESPSSGDITSPDYFNQIFTLEESINEKGDPETFITGNVNGKDIRGRYLPTGSDFGFEIKEKSENGKVVAAGVLTYEIPNNCYMENKLDLKHQFGCDEIMLFVPNTNSDMLKKPEEYTDNKVHYPIGDTRVPYLNPGLYEFKLDSTEKYDFYYQSNETQFDESSNYYWSNVKKMN